jgi:hypothetical protein
MREYLLEKAARYGDKIVLVSHCFTGQHGIICMDCSGELIVKKGEQKKHHFCHHKGSDCVLFSGGGCNEGETDEHKAAKIKIANRFNESNNMTISQKICFRCEKKIKLYNLTEYRDAGYFAVNEYKYTDKNGIERRADVAIIDNSGNIHIIIEIFKSHATPEGNREGCMWVELSAYSVEQNTDDHFNCVRIPCVSCDECSAIITEEQAFLKRIYEYRFSPDEQIDEKMAYLFKFKRATRKRW